MICAFFLHLHWNKNDTIWFLDRHYVVSHAPNAFYSTISHQSPDNSFWVCLSHNPHRQVSHLQLYCFVSWLQSQPSSLSEIRCNKTPSDAESRNWRLTGYSWFYRKRWKPGEWHPPVGPHWSIRQSVSQSHFWRRQRNDSRSVCMCAWGPVCKYSPRHYRAGFSQRLFDTLKKEKGGKGGQGGGWCLVNARDHVSHAYRRKARGRQDDGSTVCLVYVLLSSVHYS